MKQTDWSAFVVTRGGERSDAIAGLCAFFYFERPIHVIAAELAEGIDRYVQYQRSCWRHRIRDVHRLRLVPGVVERLEPSMRSGQRAQRKLSKGVRFERGSLQRLKCGCSGGMVGPST